MTTIEDIIRIAVNAHDGQKDMVGNPAILHVLSVGLMGKTDAEKKAGLLHDVVEDTSISISDLREKGVEEGVLEAVDLLTHRDGAIQVKLNDLHHNLWRAKDALNTLDTGSAERRELLGEILRIAEIHDRAEKFIRRSTGINQ